MEIAVVRPGETLWQIARRYGVTVDQVAALNGLRDPNRLVPGMALLIPTERRHVVRPGESLWRIAALYGTSIDAIARENRLTNVNLIYPGQSLVIPRGTRPVIEANAYQANLATGDVSATAEAAPYVTYISMFSAAVTEDGDVVPPRAEAFISTAHQGGAATLLTLTNFRGSTFSSDLASAFLNNDAAVQRAIDELVIILRVQGYAGLNVDFEYVYPSDRVPYNNFLRRLQPRLHAEGFSLSTALAPKVRADQPGLLYEAHDYPVHGEVCDFVVLMTYEWGYSGGPPMAVSPIDQVRRVLDFAVTQIPREKIMMGQNLYGYDWTLPYRPGGEFARAISPQQAIRQAAQRGVAIQFDPTAQAPFYRYVDEQGRTHEVWFEDARSIQAKFNLLREMGLRGISYWKLGLAFPQNWLLLEDNFTVVKRASS